MKTFYTDGAVRCRVLVDDDFCKERHYFMHNGYVVGSRGQRLHRIVTKCPRGKVVDHIDGNPLNNTRANLRICSNKENVRARSAVSLHSASGVVGVTLHKGTLRWISSITVDSHTKHLGYFANVVEAVRCRKQAERTHFGAYSTRGSPDMAHLESLQRAVEVERAVRARKPCANNRSGFKGVHWNDRDSLWVAQIRINGAKKHIGCYKSFEDACTARHAAEIAKSTKGVTNA